MEISENQSTCSQIIDCLIENVFRLKETNQTELDESQRRGFSQRLVACLTTLHQFIKVRHQLLVNSVIMLQPFLTYKCRTRGDYQIISSIAHTLELVVPPIEHPSETFLAQPSRPQGNPAGAGAGRKSSGVSDSKRTSIWVRSTASSTRYFAILINRDRRSSSSSSSSLTRTPRRVYRRCSTASGSCW